MKKNTVLDRPMFRTRARHYHQINTDQIPKAYGSALFSMGNILDKGRRLWPAAKKGFQTYREARKAQPPSIYQRKIAPELAKWPKTMAAGKTGAGGYLTYTGAQEVGKGLGIGRDNVFSPSDLAYGIGTMAFGVPWAGTGIKSLMQAGKPTPLKIKGAQLAGKIDEVALPKSTAVGIGGLGAGFGLEKLGLSNEGIEFTSDDVRIMELIAPSIIGKNPDQIVPQEWDIVIDYYKKNKDKIIESLEEQKVLSEPVPAKDVKVKEETETIQVGPGKAIEFPVPPSDKKVIKDVTEGEDSTLIGETTPNMTGTDELTIDEANVLAADKEKNKEAATNLYNKEYNEGSNSQKLRYMQFRESIESLTGETGSNADLLLAKLGAGLMSGRSPHQGLRGLVDIAGQSIGPVVDTAMALRANDKKNEIALATAFLKADAKAKGVGGIKAKGSAKTYRIADPNSITGYRNVALDYDTNNQQWIQMGVMPNGTIAPIPYQVPPGAGMPVESQGTAAQQAKIRSSLASTTTAYEYANWVRYKMGDENKGLPGGLRFGLHQIRGVFNTLTYFGEKGHNGKNLNKYVEEDILVLNRFEGDPEKGTTAQQELDKAIKQYNEDKKDAVSHAKRAIKNTRKYYDSDFSEDELEAQAVKAILYQLRMKYAVANANKAEDRLTQKDIENAAGSTEVMGWIPLSKGGRDPTTINARMETLMTNMNNQFIQLSKRYVWEGGDDEYLASIGYKMPFIIQWNEKQLQKRGAVDVSTVIDNIDITKITGGN